LLSDEGQGRFIGFRAISCRSSAGRPSATAGIAAEWDVIVETLLAGAA
jgi:hypothetical protein